MFSNNQTNNIVKIFAGGDDMYQNHSQAAALLKEMAADINVLYQVIEYNLSQPGFLKKTQTYTTLAMDIAETPDLSFVVNIFPSLPDRNTEISFQSVHHHGYMLLSTIAAFGPGYKAITFKKGFEIDKNSGITKMAKEKIYHNNNHSIDFIDTDTPHIVFYTQSISATYALWSKNTKHDASHALKNIPFILKFKKTLRKIIEALHLEKMAGIAKVEYYDFYPDNGKLIAMKDRIHYDPTAGTNENFIQNIVHFIQQTGYNNVGFLAELAEKQSTPAFAKKIIAEMISGNEIKYVFVNSYLSVPKVNLRFEEVVAATG